MPPAQTVEIGECDSGVPNQQLQDGSYISDKIAACEASARNHGQFTSCVARAINGLGLKRNQRGSINRCAARYDMGTNNDNKPLDIPPSDTNDNTNDNGGASSGGQPGNGPTGNNSSGGFFSRFFRGR
jgi:hypothetical protein